MKKKYSSNLLRNLLKLIKTSFMNQNKHFFELFVFLVLFIFLQVWEASFPSN